MRQLVITKCDSFIYYKVWQVLLQSATGITKCDSFITKCDRYYKVRWLLQSATEHSRKRFSLFLWSVILAWLKYHIFPIKCFEILYIFLFQSVHAWGTDHSAKLYSVPIAFRWFIKDGAYKYRGIFVQFVTMREKQILARAIGIQKEN